MNDDGELLCRYADEGSESAFAELVRRHVDLVFGAALRRLGGDPHLAAEVAQQVFTTLARDARKLSHHSLLPAWLHTATRNAAFNLMTSENRRQARETEALALSAIGAAGDASPDWDQLRPVLDAAIDELPEADRTAVILRFLERRPFAEIGTALQVTEDAARMRTDRALDKLRSALARHGITSTATAVGSIVLTQPMVSAPVGLAAKMAAAAINAAGSGSLVTFMSTKLIATATLSALVAFGAGTYVSHNRAASAPVPSTLMLPDQSRTIVSLQQDNLALKAEAARLDADVALLSEANARLKQQLQPKAPPKNPTLGLAQWEVQRTILNNLRQIDAARKQYKLEHGSAPNSITLLVGRRSYIKTVRTVGGEDYSGLSMEENAPLTVTTLDGDTVTYDPAGSTTTRPVLPPEVVHAEALGQKIRPQLHKAVAAYQAAHHGMGTADPKELLPYFATPEEAADFLEMIEADKAASATGP